jgi:hypothetical protein
LGPIPNPQSPIPNSFLVVFYSSVLFSLLIFKLK